MSTLPPHVALVSVRTILPLRARVLRPGLSLEHAVMSMDEDPYTQHFAWMQGERVCACATVQREPHPEQPAILWRLRGMAVDFDVQRQGVGSALLRAIMAQVQASMWCQARLSAAPFYETLGWKREGATFEIVGIGPHVRMVSLT